MRKEEYGKDEGVFPEEYYNKEKEFNLSREIEIMADNNGRKFNVLLISSVKEFIKKLKEGWETTKLVPFRHIDKLAGDL